VILAAILLGILGVWAFLMALWSVMDRYWARNADDGGMNALDW